MITLRLIENLASEYPEFEGWWKAHGFPPVPMAALNTMGLVAESEGKKLAVAWVYTASTGALAMMEWLVTNKDASPIQTVKAVDALVEFAAEECARRGYGVLFTTCRQKALARLYERHGYQKTDEGMIHFVKVLKPSGGLL